MMAPPPASSPAPTAAAEPILTGPRRVPIHIEARTKPECVVPRNEVQAHVVSYVASHVHVFRPGPLEGFAAADALLGQTLESLVVAEMGGDSGEQAVSAWRSDPLVHVYVMADDDDQPAGGVDFALSEGEEGGPTAFSAHVCPCRELAGLWESIYVAPATKEVLLSMSATALLFSMKGVDPHLVSGNRMILLHGPPGTGKSTLARGLAHKLAIRHADAFAGGVELLCVNAHSLISKFFGESSQNVGRVFSHIRERVAEEQGCLFIVVMDEVETVCSSREAALARGSNEPGDAVRVVNAFLTEIDRLRAFKNVLLVATSNLTTALDAAFQDRCDLRIHIGLPTPEGRYHILRSSLAELMRAGVVGPPSHLPQRLELLQHAPQQAAQMLLRLVELTGLGSGGGLSGRALRKLPLQAHALMGGTRPPPVPLLEFLRAMEQAVAGLLEVQAEDAAAAAAAAAGKIQGNGPTQPPTPRRDHHQ